MSGYYGGCADGCVLGRGHSGGCLTLTAQPGPRPSRVATPQEVANVVRMDIVRNMRDQADKYETPSPDHVPADVYRTRARWLRELAEQIQRGDL